MNEIFKTTTWVVLGIALGCVIAFPTGAAYQKKITATQLEAALLKAQASDANTIIVDGTRIDIPDGMDLAEVTIDRKDTYKERQELHVKGAGLESTSQDAVTAFDAAAPSASVGDAKTKGGRTRFSVENIVTQPWFIVSIVGCVLLGLAAWAFLKGRAALAGGLGIAGVFGLFMSVAGAVLESNPLLAVGGFILLCGFGLLGWYISRESDQDTALGDLVLAIEKTNKQIGIWLRNRLIEAGRLEELDEQKVLNLARRLEAGRPEDDIPGVNEYLKSVIRATATNAKKLKNLVTEKKAQMRL
jgi:hypothetical protein